MAKVRRSDKLLAVLDKYEEVLLVVHDNPDPDAIATGWALATLVEERLHKPATLVGGGAVVRAENLRLIELLHPPITLLDSLEVHKDQAVVLVDCSPAGSNHLLEGTSVKPVAVIDHHNPKPIKQRMGFKDIRPNVAAAATIASTYLQEQGLTPGPALATALIYAIRTETKGSDNPFSALDVKILSWLNPFADHNQLNEIENAPLPRDYFSDLLLALESTFIYDNVALCFLPYASGPETIGEVADLLIRCENINSLLCVGFIAPHVLVSCRTAEGAEDATDVLTRTLQGIGYCGGHEQRAGGKLIVDESRTKMTEEMQSDLRSRWLGATGKSDRRGSRLVAKKDILDHL